MQTDRLYWVDEEHVAKSPPEGAIVCDSLLEVSLHLRQLPPASRSSVLVVLGPRMKSAPIALALPAGHEVLVAVDNQTGRDLEIEHRGHYAPSKIGTA